MKKAGLHGLRVLMVLAGLAVIFLTITWEDRIVFPAGYTLPGEDRLVFAEETAWPVIEEKDVTYTVGKSPRFYEIDQEHIGQLPDQPQFQPGVWTMLKQAKWGWIGLGALAMFWVWPIQTTRWWLLMRCRGLVVSWWLTLKLVMIGLFFNFCMPGSTGGDLARAYYAARGGQAADRKAVAIVSIVVDRIAGLMGLILLGSLLGIGVLHQPEFASIVKGVWLAVSALLVAGVIYATPFLRQLIRLDHWLPKLPLGHFLHQMDQALLAYRKHPVSVLAAVGLSVFGHLGLVLTFILAGKALGMEVPWSIMFVAGAVIFLASGIPITYQGLGIMEGIGIMMLATGPDALASANQVVGALVLYRLIMLGYGLIGAVPMFKGQVRLHPENEEIVTQ